MSRRITPACAGRSLCSAHSSCCRLGSPPRVRGEVFMTFRHGTLHRITPACAGRRYFRRAHLGHRGDHPRVCGEKWDFPSLRKARSGSPPRVRGEVRKRGLAAPCDGITPACAGRSATTIRSFRSCTDHPRVCGEKQHVALLGYRLVGSPPRVRGEGTTGDRVDVKKRITPACAGRSSGVNYRIAAFEDHPRVCGEKVDIDADNRVDKGSPPRVRGEVPFTGM